MSAQQDRIDREMLRSMSASFSYGFAFSFHPQDMANLLFRMSERIDPNPLRADLPALQADLAAAVARAEKAERDRDCFQRMTRAHWEALCAMRNSINEYVPMPNTDSGPLFSPEDGPIYADIAERVAADLKESREYALALQQELKDRAAKSDPIIAASKRVLHDIDDLVANSEGVSGLHMNGEVADWQSIMAGGSFGAWLESVEILRAAVALAACDAKTPAND